MSRLEKILILALLVIISWMVAGALFQFSWQAVDLLWRAFS